MEAQPGGYVRTGGWVGGKGRWGCTNDDLLSGLEGDTRKKKEAWSSKWGKRKVWCVEKGPEARARGIGRTRVNDKLLNGGGCGEFFKGSVQTWGPAGPLLG